MHLALFISLKSLFMDNEQCQTHIQKRKEKKKAKNATQETQYPNATYMLKFAYLILF